jgi:hypothetical protein
MNGVRSSTRKRVLSALSPPWANRQIADEDAQMHDPHGPPPVRADTDLTTASEHANGGLD